MPNHITSRLTITGASEEISKVFDFIKSEGPCEDGNRLLIDLNKILPMPEALDIESSSLADDGAKYILGGAGNILERGAYENTPHYAHMKQIESENPKMFERAIELGKRKLHNIAEYGAGDWYDWRIKNWGTKWNTYSNERIDDFTIQFQTAWSGIPAMIASLAAKFPAVTIEYKYADEDASYNVGSYIMHGEDIKDLSPKDGSPEAWELVFELDVVCREDYVRQPDGTYKYREDDED